jgi:hypothetical protein
MIHHISIDAQNPFRVARVLAEILDGKAFKFLFPGSYTVMPFDTHGTAVVVLPQGSAFAPGTEVEVAQVKDGVSTANLVASHTAISIIKSQQQLEQIGEREGWRVLTHQQGDAPFRVIEFWVENRTLFEFLPLEFAAQYLRAMQPDVIEPILGSPLHPLPT